MFNGLRDKGVAVSRVTNRKLAFTLIGRRTEDAHQNCHITHSHLANISKAWIRVRGPHKVISIFSWLFFLFRFVSNESFAGFFILILKLIVFLIFLYACDSIETFRLATWPLEWTDWCHRLISIWLFENKKFLLLCNHFISTPTIVGCQNAHDSIFGRELIESNHLILFCRFLLYSNSHYCRSSNFFYRQQMVVFAWIYKRYTFFRATRHKMRNDFFVRKLSNATNTKRQKRKPTNEN